MMINIRETAMVKPAAETPKRRLWNSNLDLIVPRHHTESVYFYRRPAESGDGFFESGRMKEALAAVLVPFYPMAGRLARDDDDEKGRVEIDCNGEGVLFVVSETESTVEDFGDFAPTVEMMKLIPAVEYSDDTSSFPLLVLQVTHFSCGGAAVGVGMLHIIADGYSGIHFINSWSNFARGLPIDPPPFMDRTLLRARNPPAPSSPHIEYHHPPALIAAIPPAAAAVNIFPLSRANLDQLRSKASSSRFSSYSLIAAHVWRCACLARGLPPDQLSKLHIAVDGRRRLQPPLPEGYFGNVVFTAAPVAKARELAEGIGVVAGMIQEAVGRMEDEYVRSAVDYLEVKEDLKEMVRGAHTFGCPNIGIISWTRMAIYDADFGWGKPVFMGPGGIAYEGMSFVLPAAGGGAGVSVVISLQMDHMSRFKELFYQF